MLLSVKDLNCEMSGLHILNGVSLTIEKGGIVGLIGPNGSGKTTLFNCICGFVPTISGTVKLADRDISRAQPYDRALAGLGRVFQNCGVFREMTVMENIITALESRQSFMATFWPWSKQNKLNKEQALVYLQQVKLADKFKHKAGSLSGGQLRLLEIIRTLAFGAELFLLDEPTAGVSPKMKDELITLIKSLRQLGKTVLIIEHDINFIERLCDRIAVLDQGRVVLDDKPEVVRTHPLLQEIYFGQKG